MLRKYDGTVWILTTLAVLGLQNVTDHGQRINDGRTFNDSRSIFWKSSDAVSANTFLFSLRNQSCE